MTYRRTPFIALLVKFAALAVVSLAAVTVATGAAAQQHHHPGDSAIGQPGDASRVDREIRVEMKDSMRFIPGRIKVKKGETVRLVVVNTGRLDHEFVLGSAAMLRHHADEMKAHPHMQHES